MINNFAECVNEALKNLGIVPRELKKRESCNLSFTLTHRFSPSMNIDITVGSCGEVTATAFLSAVIKPSQRTAVIEYLNFLAASKRYIAIYLDNTHRVVCKYSFLLGGDDDVIVDMGTKVISALLAEVSCSAYQLFIFARSLEQ